jgi:broad specificity phosphatase PhoE
VGQTTFLLVRHGEADWNVERRVQGHSDRPLTQVGVAQARALAEQLADEPIDAVYSSDLARAHDTARLIADAHGLQVETLPELRERDFGTWEGLTDDEVFIRFPQARTGSWGDAETKEELEARIRDAMGRIASRHPEGRVLVVTHGGPLRVLIPDSLVDGDDRSIPNCHLIRLAFRDGGFVAPD